MSLKEYNEKRNFGVTGEPEEGKTGSAGKAAIFVVQKHNASHLHYDFRLESGGVLKSWAVPKGPSMNPHDKRLAVMVEDHPLEYARFHGRIPDGQYGAGTVEIWDSGTWEPADKTPDPAKALKEGLLEFYLHGRKLNGEFVLVRTDGSYAKNGWLLMKKEDGYSGESTYDANEK